MIRRLVRALGLLSAIAVAQSAISFSPILISEAQAQARTDAYCRSYARDVSWRYSRGGAVGGAVRGGTGGASVAMASYNSPGSPRGHG